MCTEHLTDEQLYQHFIDREELSLDHLRHLDHCSHCAHRANFVTWLMSELAVTKNSQPSERALQGYTALFTYVKQNAQPSAVVELWNALRATLLLDSRQESLAGTRNANITSYRLLYTTERADIELLVEPANQGRRIEGEILALEHEDRLTPALLQLQNTTMNAVLHETECNEMGRFQFDEVQPDRYQLLITPLQGATIQVDSLNIT